MDHENMADTFKKQKWLLWEYAWWEMVMKGWLYGVLFGSGLFSHFSGRTDHAASSYTKG